LNGTGGPVTSQASVQVAAAVVLPAVTLLTPAQGATDLQTNVNLSWDAVQGATGYEVQVGTDNLFANLVYTNTSVTGTSQMVPGLKGSTTYYWRVCAKNATTVGPYASAWNFSTIANGRKNQFPIFLQGPAPEEDSLMVNVTKAAGVDSAYITMWIFDADAADEGVLYVNETDSLALFGSMAAPTRDCMTTTFTMRMSAAAWKDGENILWFAHRSTAGYRVDSIAVSFTKSSVTCGSQKKAPTTYALGQNYPNPFNPSTMIPFDVRQSSHVTLTVYNLLGHKITTLVDEIRSEGSYQVRFNAAALSSGIYFYRLVTSDGFLEQRRMLLVK